MRLWLLLWLVLALLLCVACGCCLAQHTQLLLVLLVIKGLFLALCCLKMVDWDVILADARGEARPAASESAETTPLVAGERRSDAPLKTL